eukprot:gene26092-11800_t
MDPERRNMEGLGQGAQLRDFNNNNNNSRWPGGATTTALIFLEVGWGAVLSEPQNVYLYDSSAIGMSRFHTGRHKRWHRGGGAIVRILPVYREPANMLLGNRMHFSAAQSRRACLSRGQISIDCKSAAGGGRRASFKTKDAAPVPLPPPSIDTLQQRLESAFGAEVAERIVQEGWKQYRRSSFRVNLGPHVDLASKPSQSYVQEVVKEVDEAIGLSSPPQDVRWFRRSYMLPKSLTPNEIKALKAVQSGRVYFQSLSSMLPALCLGAKSKGNEERACLASLGSSGNSTRIETPHEVRRAAEMLGVKYRASVCPSNYRLVRGPRLPPPDTRRLGDPTKSYVPCEITHLMGYMRLHLNSSAMSVWAATLVVKDGTVGKNGEPCVYECGYLRIRRECCRSAAGTWVICKTASCT